MEYEVANGQSIPNLGERRCLVWTEGASQAKKMNMQVADVHRGLLSLRQCADMGFESRLGRRASALICENTGEVIPLIGKGNLYVLCFTSMCESRAFWPAQIMTKVCPGAVWPSISPISDIPRAADKLRVLNMVNWQKDEKNSEGELKMKSMNQFDR